MSKRIFIVVVVAVAFLSTGMAVDTASGGGDHHKGKIPIKWKVSGTIANTFFYPTGGSPDPPLPGLLIQAVLKGAPGNGQFTITSFADPFNPSLTECGGGPGQTVKDNDMVVILDDLSMIFAKLQTGWVCINADYTVSAEAHMIITGGTGKYMGASGYFEGHFLGQSVGTSGFLAAETGNIEGEIYR